MTFFEVLFLGLIFIPLILMWVFALIDLFRRHDLHGWQVALWVVLIVFVPIIGVLAYFIARPAPYDLKYGDTDQDSPDTTNVASQLRNLKAQHDDGAIDDDEYAAMKAKLLA